MWRGQNACNRFHDCVTACNPTVTRVKEYVSSSLSSRYTFSFSSFVHLLELEERKRERERKRKRIETFGNLIVTKCEQESNGVACLVGAQRRRQVRLTLSVIR